MKPAIDYKPKTLMEVFKMLPEGTLAELIENQLYMSPSPSRIHQSTLKKLARKLGELVDDSGKGEVLFAPFDVFLDEERNAVQPDIIVILNGNSGVFTDTGHFRGVPDLVVEILSPGNRDHDLLRKKALYEKFAVKEYWVIDPDSRMCLVYQLRNSSFEKVNEEKGLIQSPLLDSHFKF